MKKIAFSKWEWGFTLVELLIYLGILSVVSGLFLGMLSVTTKVQIRESASNEVSSQANFVLQTIQRLIRESSAIIVADPQGVGCIDTGDNDTAPLGTARTCLKLRMKNSAQDPTCIFMDVNSVKVAEGPRSGNVKLCTDAASALTTSKVEAAGNILTFTKFTNYPGHDTVQIDLTLNYNDANPAAQYAKTLKSAVSRVSAATFDSGLLPGTGGTLDIGQSTSRWRDGYFSGAVDISGTIKQSGNYGGAGRGFFTAGAPSGTDCTTICQNHGLACDTTNPGWVLSDNPTLTTCGSTVANRLCFCE